MIRLKKFAMGALLCLPLPLAQGISAENLILTTPQNFQVVSMSPNGKWACGVFIDSSSTTQAFRWNLETGKVEMAGAVSESIAWGISNDGTVSGNFSCKTILPYGNPLQAPGIYRDGRWTASERPAGADKAEGFGYGITADGRSMSGTVYINGILTPVIWRDGKVYKTFATPKHSMAYCISPDGETVAGWTYGPKHSNRVATYWTPEGTARMLLKSPEHSESMFNTAKAFSPDGKMLLYWGGWDPTTNDKGEYVDNFLYALYDIAKDEQIKVPVPSISSNTEFFALSNSGLMLGSEKERGFVYLNGEGMYIDDYLKKIGVDLSKFDDFYSGEGYSGEMPIFRCQNVSEDEKTYIFLYYDKEGLIRSMCVKTDRDLSSVPPVGVTAHRMPGLNTVALTWMAPAGAKGIRGYNIYRGDKKLNGFLPLNRLYYYDANLTEGSYTYKIAAVNAAGDEIFADDVEVAVTADAISAPGALFVRQKGADNASVSWDVPESNMPHLRYFDPESDAIEAMSVYQPIEMEAAVRYDKNDLAQYAGAKVKQVSFMPMAEQESWTIVFYTRGADGKLVEIARQPVTGELNYKALNTVTLPEPLTLPEGDLIVALRVKVGDVSADVVGAENGPAVPGSSDLLRQASEPDFYSAFDSSVSTGMSVSSTSWAIEVALEMPGYDAAKDAVDHYDVSVNGAKVQETKTLSAFVPSLEDGTHKVGVVAVYADGRRSAMVERDVDIKGVYDGVDVNRMNVAVTVDDATSNATVNASWEAPLNTDRLSLSYDPAEKPTYGVKGVNNAVIIGADYVSSMLRGYDGYRIESVAFYPMCDAIFTVGIYENDKIVYEHEIMEVKPNSWCTVTLDKDIKIKENANYRLVVDAFDAEPGADIFGVGREPAFSYRSDLYSVDGGTSYNSYSFETGRNASWLLKFNLAEVDGVTLTPEGYDVLIDGVVRNSERLAEPKCSIEMGNEAVGSHKIAVNTYYAGLTDAVGSGEKVFRVTSSGIEGNVTASISLRQSATRLVAEGEGVEAITLISTGGVEVARALGNTLDLADVASGMYIVKVDAGAASFTRKISIK